MNGFHDLWASCMRMKFPRTPRLNARRVSESERFFHVIDKMSTTCDHVRPTETSWHAPTLCNAISSTNPSETNQFSKSASLGEAACARAETSTRTTMV